MHDSDFMCIFALDYIINHSALVVQNQNIVLMKKFLFYCIPIFILLFSHKAEAQIYIFSTDVDQNEWVELQNFSSVTSNETAVTLPFDFCFFEHYYRQIWINFNGAIHFGRRIVETNIDNALAGFVAPCIVPFGNILWKTQGEGWYIHYKTIGAEGNRTFVIDFQLTPHNLYSSTDQYRKFQIRLKEADQSLTIQYGPNLGPNTYYAAIGLKGDIDFRISQYSNAIVAFTDNEPPVNSNCAWPGEYRYYTLTPPQQPKCGTPRKVSVSYSDDHHVELGWPRSIFDSMYVITYYEDGVTTDSVTLTTTENSISINSLPPATKYRYNFYTICKSGLRSKPFPNFFTTVCNQDAQCAIRYWDFESSDVECRTGNWAAPSFDVNVVNYGPEHPDSRHSVNIDPTETDPLSGGLLYKIPPGHCTSVRLGDLNPGAREESITYKIRVDTNNFSILLLSYALVEENPNHIPDHQPKFTLLITNLNDEPLSTCYIINFVSGTGSSWNYHDTIAWSDWQTIGLDLTPFHGQYIKVKLDNYDCQEGLHKGYAYYSLGTSLKSMRSSACGESFDTIVFHAPKGFTYRWYKTDQPNNILSTADSLVVTEFGSYTCQALFMGSTECGFTITSYAGPRFPFARMNVTVVDECHTQFRFEDHSVITTDEAHTQLTNQRCDSCFWRFDDGTTTTGGRVVHTFTPGSHWAELVATLSDGTCRDSVRITLDVGNPTYEVYDSICQGGYLDFHGQRFEEAGVYEVDDGCIHYTLHLETYQLYFSELADTICEGEVFRVGNHYYDMTGTFLVNDTSINGCDSNQMLYLTVRPRPSGLYELLHTCHGEAYYYIKGSFTEADSAFQTDGSQAYLCDDTVLMRWTPSSPSLPTLYYGPDGFLWLKADIDSKYYVCYEYLDDPICAVCDTLTIKGINDIEARLKVSPEWLNMNNLEYTATDHSIYSTGRVWFIDDVEQEETSRVLQGIAQTDADSVRLKLRAFNKSCSDSVTITIPIIHSQVFFPNIFTPAQSTNNTFAPVGKDLTDYELWIYDRRGDLVFHTNNPEQPWDGTSNGRICKQDTYVYTCIYTTRENDRKRSTGTITLIR